MLFPALIAVIAVLFAVSADAKMQCSVIPAAQCADTILLKLSNYDEGGGHAGLPHASSFPNAVCCSGIEGLSVSAEQGQEMIWLSAKHDAHAAVAGEGSLKIKSNEKLTCGYTRNCGLYETCLFSISGETDAHVSDCRQYAFPVKYCCTTKDIKIDRVDAGGAIDTERIKTRPGLGSILRRRLQNIIYPPSVDRAREVPDIPGVIEDDELEDITPPSIDNIIDGPIMQEAFNDDDNDGVINIEDECPETPEGEYVLDNGCRCFDSDNGRDIMEKGITRWKSNTGETIERADACTQDGRIVFESSSTLLEYSCNSKAEYVAGIPAAAMHSIECATGCWDGACIAPVRPAFPVTCFSSGGSCNDNIQNQNEDGIDCGGKCPPCNTKCGTRTKYAPEDTPCTSHFISQTGRPTYSDETQSDQHRIDVSWLNGGLECNCQMYEVCDPGLDHVIEEAVGCCSSQSWDETDSKGALCREAITLGSSDCKRCVGIYIIRGLGRYARWMRGYERNSSMDYHICGLTGDASPAERLVNYHKTGICRDYAGVLTTLLRKAGYSQSEVGTYCDGAHCYNIVKLSGDRKWHIADTTGNSGDISLGGLPGGYNYCPALNESNVCFGGRMAVPIAESGAPPSVGCSGDEEYNREGMLPECGPGIACYRDNYALPDFAPSIKDIVGCS